MWGKKKKTPYNPQRHFEAQAFTQINLSCEILQTKCQILRCTPSSFNFNDHWTIDKAYLILNTWRRKICFFSLTPRQKQKQKPGINSTKKKKTQNGFRVFQEQEQASFLSFTYQSLLPCNVPNSPAQGLHSETPLLWTSHRWGLWKMPANCQKIQ